MRIAYLLADPGIGVFGTKGASVHVQEVVRAMRGLGHEVTVFCTRRDREVPADLSDLRVITVPVGAAAGAAEREAQIARAAVQLAELAACESFDLVYERYSLFSEAGALLADRLGAPLAIEVNAPLVEEQRQHRVLHDEEGAWAGTRRGFARATVLSCVSEPVADWVRRAVPEAAARAVVIPNGVNTTRISPAPRDPSRPFTIGFIGTLKPWHGTEILLDAFAAASHPGAVSWRLDICGKGPELAALRARAERLGIAERVRFRGAVPPQDIPLVLAGMDVAAAPYPQGEHYFSPLKVYEYLAAGLPVVASAIGGLPALLDGGRGLLVPPGDAAALADALDVLAADPALRGRLSRAARAAAEEEHAWTLRCRDLLEQLEQLEVTAR